MIFLLGQQAPAAGELYDIVVLEPVPPIWPLVFWSILSALLFFLIGVAIWHFLKRGHLNDDVSALGKVKNRFVQIERTRIASAPNQFSLAVSDALKDYLSEKFDDPVRFETSQEFLKRTSHTKSKLPESARKLLQAFLAESEELKFGNAAGGDSVLLPLLQHADEVVNVCEKENAEKAKRGKDEDLV